MSEGTNAVISWGAPLVAAVIGVVLGWFLARLKTSKIVVTASTDNVDVNSKFDLEKDLKDWVRSQLGITDKEPIKGHLGVIQSECPELAQWTDDPFGRRIVGIREVDISGKLTVTNVGNCLGVLESISLSCDSGEAEINNETTLPMDVAPAGQTRIDYKVRLRPGDPIEAFYLLKRLAREPSFTISARFKTIGANTVFTRRAKHRNLLSEFSVHIESPKITGKVIEEDELRRIIDDIRRVRKRVISAVIEESEVDGKRNAMELQRVLRMFGGDETDSRHIVDEIIKFCDLEEDLSYYDTEDNAIRILSDTVGVMVLVPNNSTSVYCLIEGLKENLETTLREANVSDVDLLEIELPTLKTYAPSLFMNYYFEASRRHLDSMKSILMHIRL